jgi:phosphatidylglycerophosphate synthase
MLDAVVRRFIDRPLLCIGGAAAKRGLTANAVTAAGFGVGAAACVLLAYQAYKPALFAMLLSRALDGIDGAIARRTKPTDLGGFLDIVADFIFYAGFVYAFAVGRPEHALPAAFLIFSFLGTGSSFLAFAVVAEKRGLSTAQRGVKSFYYLGGLTEGTETILLFVLICLFPEHFPSLAYVFGLLCWLTTVGRVATGFRVFAQPG